MGKVTFELIEQMSDAKAKHIAYKFTVSNHGNIAIDIHSITPQNPGRRRA